MTAVEAQKTGLKVTFEDADGETSTDTFDRVLVAVGRRPNGKLIDAETAGVAVDDRGFIAVDDRQRTNVPPYLRHRRRGRPADAGAQGGARGQGRGRGRGGPQRVFDAP